MTTNLEAARIATKAEDAFSREKYTTAGWIGIAKRLAVEGASPAEIEWVLRSKHMRWAADFSNRRSNVTLFDFASYVERPGGLKKNGGSWAILVAEARKETTQVLSGADLAGACEGEQIAEALDLLREAAAGKSIQARAFRLLQEIENRAKESR